MAERKVVNDLQGPEDIKQVASGGDTYYRPTEAGVQDPRDPNSMLQGLAAGLAKFEPRLQEFVSTKYTEYTKEQIAAGEAARRENQAAFAQAVKEGKLPRIANPYFMKGYYNQSGQLDANDYTAKLDMAYAQSGVRNSNNPADIKKFTEDFRSNYLKEVGLNKNRDWSDGFEPGLKRAESMLYSKHLNARAKAMEEESLNNLFLQVGQNIQGQLAAQEDPFNEEGAVMDRAALQANIKMLADTAIKNGNDPTEVNRKLVDAVGAEMIKSGDKSLEKLLDGVTTPGGTLAKTQYAQAKMQQVKDKITSDEINAMRNEDYIENRPHVREARAWEQKNRQRLAKKYDTDSATEPLVKILIGNMLSGKTLDEETLKQLHEIDAPTALQMKNAFYQNEQQRSVIRPDQPFINQILLDINENPNDPTIVTRISRLVPEQRGDFGVVSSLLDKQLLRKEGKEKDVREFEPFKNAYEKISMAVINDPTMQFGEGQTRALQAKNDLWERGKAIVNDKGMSDEAKAKAIDAMFIDTAKKYNVNLDQNIRAGENKQQQEVRVAKEEADKKAAEEANKPKKQTWSEWLSPSNDARGVPGAPGDPDARKPESSLSPADKAARDKVLAPSSAPDLPAATKARDEAKAKADKAQADYNKVRASVPEGIRKLYERALVANDINAVADLVATYPGLRTKKPQ